MGLFSMKHSEDEHDIPVHSEDYTIVTDAKLPVGLEGLAQRLRVVLRRLAESRLDRVSDSLSRCTVDSRQIALSNLRMVRELVAHCDFQTSSCETAVSAS